MPPIDLGPARPTSAIGACAVGTTASGSAKAGRTSKPEAAMVQSDTLDPGEAPIDMERVEFIRKAIESDTYPVVPAKVADAMIAAGMMLRFAK